MKKKSFCHSLLPGIMMLAAVLSSACTEDLNTEITTNLISFTVDDTHFGEEGTPTRGAKVSSVSSFGVSASIYNASSTYTSAGCGSYFFNESASAGVPVNYFWPISDYKLSFFAYYPYGNSAFTIQSAANATGAPTYAYTVPSAIANQVDVMTAQNVNILGGGSSPVSLTFKHRCAAIHFSITNDRSDAIIVNSISIEGVKYTGTLSGSTWTLGSSVNSSSTNPFTLTYGSSVAAGATVDITGTSNIFMMLPQTLPAGAKLKIVVDDEEFETDLSGTWVAGKEYTYTISMSESCIDLSKVDNAGNKRATMTTANCYLVHGEGDYKIPLVYGNAIKNGEVNTVAFNPGGSTTDTYCANFVNHNGDVITGPWITKNGTGINAGMGLTVASAELLWQDAIGLISDVGIDGDYLTFTVGTFTGGNALIAVKDGSGNILWSWHIWATDETLTETTTVATGYRNYAVAPVNLGWVPTGGNGKQGYCPYYQWGRKDPFIPCNDQTNGNTNKTVYNISGTNITPASITDSSTGIQREISTTATIADCVKNPIKFYYNSSTEGPATTTYYNMWDAQNSSTTYVRDATKKTIYDPCPPGFCIPTGYLCYYIANGNSRSDSNWDSTYKGKTWTLNGASIYFPALGMRHTSSARLQVVSGAGYFWSATPYSTNYGIYFYFNTGEWCLDSKQRSYGRSVRPVAEE